MYWRKNPEAYFLKKNAHLESENKEIYARLIAWEWPYKLAKEYKRAPQTIYNIKKRYETNP